MNVNIQKLSSIDTHDQLSFQTNSIIEAKNLSIGYGDSYACQDITLSLAEHKIHTIVGPSGSGKSSFLLTINRINKHYADCFTEGKLLFKQTNILSPKTNLVLLRRKIGCIFQTPVPFPFSIVKNFSIPLKAHGIRNRTEIADRTEHTLKQVGLWNEVQRRLKQPANLLSGGQQQRLIIARTLALEPELILMDEPCSALDPISTRKIEDILLELKDNFTFIVVTHNLAQAKRIADTTSVFWQKNQSGVLLEHGHCRDLFNTPKHPLTQAYIEGDQG